MKTRNLLIAAILAAAVAATAFAALSPAKAEWGKGPVQYLMTTDEKAAWKAIQTDAEAEAIATAITRFVTTPDPGSGLVTPYPRDEPAGGGGGPEGCVDPPL